MFPMTLHIDAHLSDAAWDAFVERRADGHVLQTSAWADLKSRFGWSAGRVAVCDEAEVVAGASVLFRQLPLGLATLGYIPKGPLVDWDNPPLVSALFDGLDTLCRQRRAFALKIEPDIEDGQEARRKMQEALGARHTWQTHFADTRPVQPRATILLDLTETEDEILAAMNQGTRRNIRLAARKGVVVRAGTLDDLPTFYSLMQVTGQRDGFGIHGADYYRTAFELFVPRGWAKLLVAQVAGAAAVAAIMVFALGNKAWYMYGASSNEHRDCKPNHALQWEAIRWAKSRGCATYDLWGIPDEDEATLESKFQGEDRGLWGVYRFKRGFGGRVVRYAGAFDRVYNPLLYQAFLIAMRRRASIE
jgi:lipid II:glycine glycyltransferase (peptidoglycan interpeptide bridge formation enzyme)